MLNILIVEDEEPIANLINMNLSTEGYACTCAFDGEQGADCFEREVLIWCCLTLCCPE